MIRGNDVVAGQFWRFHDARLKVTSEGQEQCRN